MSGREPVKLAALNPVRAEPVGAATAVLYWPGLPVPAQPPSGFEIAAGACAQGPVALRDRHLRAMAVAQADQASAAVALVAPGEAAFVIAVRARNGLVLGVGLKALQGRCG